jgi:hypothetical protein
MKRILCIGFWLVFVVALLQVAGWLYVSVG